jgi:hypothetical protein
MEQLNGMVPGEKLPRSKQRVSFFKRQNFINFMKERKDIKIRIKYKINKWTFIAD